VRGRFEEAGYAALVADGMGGPGGGEAASRQAIATLVDLVLATPDWILRLDEGRAEEVLRRARERAGQLQSALREEALADPSLARSGTTLTLAWSLGTALFVAHVGVEARSARNPPDDFARRFQELEKELHELRRQLRERSEASPGTPPRPAPAAGRRPAVSGLSGGTAGRPPAPCRRRRWRPPGSARRAPAARGGGRVKSTLLTSPLVPLDMMLPGIHRPGRARVRRGAGGGDRRPDRE
jgi:hypothetical protein